MKSIFSVYFLCFSLSVFGQKDQLLRIDTKETTSLKLSVIAEKVVSIPVSQSGQYFYYVPNQSLFIASASFGSSETIVRQYDCSGKLISKTNVKGLMNDWDGNFQKKELYIPVSKSGESKLKCFDYSGRLLREFLLGNRDIVACTHHKDKCWMVQYSFSNDTTYYHLSNLDYQTGKIKDCGVLHKYVYGKGPSNQGFSIASKTVFSQFNGNLFVSIGTDSIMYQIVEEGRFIPYKRWIIHPSIRFMGEIVKASSKSHYLAGNYLFVEYDRNAPEDKDGNTCKSYLYVKSIKNPSTEYNVKVEFKGFREVVSGVLDDMNYPLEYIELRSLNLSDHLFYLTQRKDEQTGEKKTWVNIVRVK